MGTKPNKWIAVLLGLFAAPLNMLYVAKPWLALVCVALLLATVFAAFILGGDAWAIVGLTQVLGAVTFAFLAYRFATRYDGSRPRPAYSRWYGLLCAAGAYLAIIFVTRAFFYEPFRIPSGSMEPTLPVGSLVVVKSRAMEITDRMASI